MQSQVSVVSSVIATLFLRTTLHSSSVSDGQTYLGLIFFAIIHMVAFTLKCHQPYPVIHTAPVSCSWNCHSAQIWLNFAIARLEETSWGMTLHMA